MFQFVEKENHDSAKAVMNILSKNRTMKGIYREARQFQSKAVDSWSGEKSNVRTCPLPTMAEDETTTLGTGAVLLQIMDLCGLINVLSGQGVDQRSILQSSDLTKWLYLVGDGLTQVRLKSFMDVIHSDSVSFRDWYCDSLVILAALGRVILGNGDLHAEGFSCLGVYLHILLWWISPGVPICIWMEEG